jgi:hypothetical protein
MGSHYLSKSNLNLDAAERLIKNPNHHHASSIHCSYYSCYQKLAHILFKIVEYSQERYTSEYRQFNFRTKGGSHEFAIMLVYELLKDNKEDAKIFKNDILELKRLRVDSDYKEIWIEKPTSDEAFRLANSISKTLKRNFNLS